jgi:hypothetical protein
MRRMLVAVVLAAPVLLAAAPVAHADQEGGGTQIGGSVSSTLALDLAQTGPTVRAVVTTTEPDSRLSVASLDGRSGLSASTTASGPYAPLDPAFGLTLVAWDDVLAGKATTLRLKSAAPAASTVLITLSATTP